jgi:hypothetical protein
LELETHEEVNLEDNDLPWPRQVTIHSDVTSELYEDGSAIKFYIENIPDRCLAEQGLKLAPGTEWRFFWREYNQKDIDHWNAFYFGMDCPSAFKVGDWHYRAEAWVVKIDAED